jgi:hypothetical protein
MNRILSEDYISNKTAQNTIELENPEEAKESYNPV